MIYVGTCGFSYKDWVGPFYPSGIKPHEMLAWYGRYFRAVEIDSSYYGVPAPKSVASMARRTPPGFRFSFKAPQSVTHPPEGGAATRVHDDARAMNEAVAPMHAAGKLACVLLQFPNAFKPEGAASQYVRRAVDAFDGLPVVVEFRNARWQRPETLELLRDLGAGYCNVDMPRLEGLLGPSSDATGPVGYVRFHGRNAKTWWRGTNVTRYDYLYSEDELRPWIGRVAEIEERTTETYAFFNNHADGKAAQNAEMFEALLDDAYGDEAPNVVARAPAGVDVARDSPQQAFDFGLE
ncbi:MAG TPA: DUF72 domain-containing protein [Candidatus Acidoferrales bacterium]|nr:DUF72 domain-containing protein [Candidatus Acidoferrales bacterium]